MIDIFSSEYLSEFRFRQTRPIKAVPTFLPTLNAICGDDGGRVGLAKGWFVVVAGNPGFGKSLLALLLARDSLRAGHKTAFVSLEMAHGQLAARFFSIASGIPIHALEKGGFNESAYEAFKERIAELFPDGGLLTNRHLLFSLDDIMTEMAFMADKGVTVFFVDYLQLIAVGDEDQLSKQVTTAVTTLRRFAAENGVLVVALSQFNRSTSANYEQTPHIQGTHGGMIIEACADVGLLLDHSRYQKDEDAPHLARTFLICDKNRHGARAAIPVEWNYKNLSCREGMDDEMGRWPKERGR